MTRAGDAGVVTGNNQQQLRAQRRTPMKRYPRRNLVNTIQGFHEGAGATDVDAAAAGSTSRIEPATKSSKFRGVTRHRSTGRYEAHLWDKSAYSVKQKKKGRQVYLGAYDHEIAAAQAYDLAALKHWGPTASINFPREAYTQKLQELGDISKEEFLASLRRKSNGFSRGISEYRGVAKHHKNGRWEARIGRVENNKYLYLGTFPTQEEAAKAYDKAAITYRGVNAVTNFPRSRYTDDKPSEEGPEKKVTRIRPKRNVKKSKETRVASSLPQVSEVDLLDPPQASTRSNSEDNGSLDLPKVQPDKGAKKTLENTSPLYAEMSALSNYITSRSEEPVVLPERDLEIEELADYSDAMWEKFEVPPVTEELFDKL